MAFAIAGITAASEPSLASLAPNGPSGSTLSTMIASICGDSAAEGERYSRSPGLMSKPSFQTISSSIACHRPIQTHPMICPSTEHAHREQQQSYAAQLLWIVNHPDHSSTLSSTTNAEQNYADD